MEHKKYAYNLDQKEMIEKNKRVIIEFYFSTYLSPVLKFFGCSEVTVKSLYLGVFKTCLVQVETFEILSAYHLCPKPVNKMRRDGCVWVCTI